MCADTACHIRASRRRRPRDDIPDPLRLVPRQADFVLRIDSPRKLVEAVLATEPVRELGQFAAVREALQSTNVRRAAQLLAYYEKELAPPGRNCSTGSPAAASCSPPGSTAAATAPCLFVVQGKDEELLEAAFGRAAHRHRARADPAGRQGPAEAESRTAAWRPSTSAPTCTWPGPGRPCWCRTRPRRFTRAGPVHQRPARQPDRKSPARRRREDCCRRNRWCRCG